jgi:hypothetical protein
LMLLSVNGTAQSYGVIPERPDRPRVTFPNTGPGEH